MVRNPGIKSLWTVMFIMTATVIYTLEHTLLFSLQCKVSVCFSGWVIHGLCGSASPVLMATVIVSGRWQLLTPYRIETPQPITKNLSQVIIVCLSFVCLSCLTVMLVYCGQTVGWNWPWPCCVRWGPSSPSLKRAQPPNFWCISVVAKCLHGLRLRCHVV